MIVGVDFPPNSRLVVATNVNDILHRALTVGDYSKGTVKYDTAGNRVAISLSAPVETAEQALARMI
ncbi:hypothetical protein, partial [Sphingomonas sp. Leaf339]|uniref:hypothetical protein n=1 Tax=Sphingomonas sp. Leaf339 TaxID=1736343 RepID=UPI000A596EA4